VSANVWELLDLIARWTHVIAGIMWVGNSLLFNWLDRTLVPSSREGVYGESWLLHSGGFYFVEKTALVGQSLPHPLHWFKWQAYTTWLSGAALLIVVYYAGGRAVMGDADVAALSHGMAVAVGAGSIVGGWAVYEAIQRTLAPRSPLATTLLLSLLFLGIVYALTSLLNGRAAFLHVGALLATIMAGNVAMTIVPSQRELVKSVTTGGRADAAISARAKRVSIHNNYFTFPVIVLMVSSHFPSLYAHRWNWLVLLLLCVTGAVVRHLMNIRFTFRSWAPALAGTTVAATVALFAMLSAGSRSNEAATAVDASGPREVSFSEARHVIDRRCAACHSANPSDLSFGVAPGGVMFDSPEQIAAGVLRIRERAVVTRTMPPGNKTRMTENERLLLGRWIEQGAALR
jgi:uncharacterized membrane protein